MKISGVETSQLDSLNSLIQQFDLDRIVWLDQPDDVDSSCVYNTTRNISAGNWKINETRLALFRMESYCNSTGFLRFDVMKQNRFTELVVAVWNITNENNTAGNKIIQTDDCFVQRVTFNVFGFFVDQFTPKYEHSSFLSTTCLKIARLGDIMVTLRYKKSLKKRFKKT